TPADVPDANHTPPADKSPDVGKPSDTHYGSGARPGAEMKRSLPAPPLPRGWLAVLPADASVQIAQGDDAKHWLIKLEGWHGIDIGLTPLISSPLPPRPQALGPLSIHRDIHVTEVVVPGVT